MPNYVRNILQINATPEKIEQVFKTIQSDTDPEQLLDFNKIIPMPKSLEIEAGSQEDLVSLYMTYINPQVFHYGIQNHQDDLPTIKQNPFLPRYRDDLPKEEIEKMLHRFSNYSEEQCLEIGNSIMITSVSMEQHPGTTGALAIGAPNGMPVISIWPQKISLCFTQHGIILSLLFKRYLNCLM